LKAGIRRAFVMRGICTPLSTKPISLCNKFGDEEAA
jgi:hypothetical protein